MCERERERERERKERETEREREREREREKGERERKERERERERKERERERERNPPSPPPQKKNLYKENLHPIYYTYCFQIIDNGIIDFILCGVILLLQILLHNLITHVPLSLVNLLQLPDSCLSIINSE